MFHIVLVHPEIPPNTGNVIRLAANTGCHLHLVEPLGFDMADKLLRRAGLDYHEFAPVRRHASWAALMAHRNALVAQGARSARAHSDEPIRPNGTNEPEGPGGTPPAGGRLFAFTTHGRRRHDAVDWQPGDWLVFGSETAGLPAAIREGFPAEHRLRLPMRPDQRSLNLSNAAAVAVFEAWRQQDFDGAVDLPPPDAPGG